MTEAISGDGAAANNSNGNGGNGFEDDEDNDSTYTGDSRTLESLEEAPNLVNNVRIKSKKYWREVEGVDGGKDALDGKKTFTSLIIIIFSLCFFCFFCPFF